MWCFHNHTHLPKPLSHPKLWQPVICSPLLWFCHLTMSCRWNCIACNLLRLPFCSSLRIIALRYIQAVELSIVVSVINSAFHFFAGSIPWYRWTTVCLTIPAFNTIRGVSSLGLLWIKLLWMFMYRCLCQQKCLFLRDKCESAITGSYGNCMFIFIRNSNCFL